MVNLLRPFRIATFFQRANFSLVMSTSKLSALNLTQGPSRTPHTRRGGYILLLQAFWQCLWCGAL